MSLITRCPHCGTNFRVTPLHLQAHGGDVRCGRCTQVFNAFSGLSTIQEPETDSLLERTADEVSEHVEKSQPVHEVPVPTAADQEEPAPSPDIAITQTEAPSEAETPGAQAPETMVAEATSATLETGEAGTANADALVQETPAFPNAGAEQSHAGTASATARASTTESVADSVSTHELKGSAHEAAAHEAGATDTDTRMFPPRDREGKTPAGEAAAKISSAQQAHPHEHARAPNHEPEPYGQEAHPGNYAFDDAESQAASFAWGLASLLLLIILTGQTIFFYRAELATVMPEAKPFLEQYCELLQCSVSLPRQQQLLNIESSDMHTDPQRPGLITLDATVRNHASYPQALPLFELTLIDAQNRSLASRIFRPDMYLEGDANRMGTIAPGKELNVRLHLDTGDLNAAGYRLSLLYPTS